MKTGTSVSDQKKGFFVEGIKADTKRIAVIGLKGLPAFGGSARATEELINHLQDRFHFVIYTISTHMQPEYVNDKYDVIILKGTRNKKLNTFLYYLQACLHAMFFGKYDLVHLQHLYSGFISPILKLKYHVVTTVRGIVPVDDNKWSNFDKSIFRVFEKLSVKYCDIIVTVSKPHIPYIQRYTTKEVVYIPNGISVDETEFPERKNYLLFSAARIISLKGCHIFLEALQDIGYKEPVTIIGDIDQVAPYRDKILHLSKGLNIEFTGLIKTKALLMTYLKNAKLFVFPSFNEGMSNMLLEAASCKSPIICSDIIENRSVFSDGDVLFFKSGDSADLMHKIVWSLDNYDQMIEKTESAFCKINSSYNWESIANQYAQIYCKLTK